MTALDAICGYCEQRIGTAAPEHFADQHPSMEWSLLTWPDGCECGGTVLIGWRRWWPLPDTPASPGLLIDLGDPDEGSDSGSQDGAS